MPFILTVCQVLIVLIAIHETCMIVNSVDSEPSYQPSHVRKRRKLDLNKLPDEQDDLSSSNSEENVLLSTNQFQQIAVLNQNEEVQTSKTSIHRKRVQSAKYYNSLTPEQKKARTIRNTARERNRFLNMSEAEKVKYREKKYQNLIKYRSKMSPEERKSLGRKYMKDYRARKKLEKSQQSDRINPRE